MTSLQIACQHMPMGWPKDAVHKLAESIDEALAEERERCAKMLDAMAAACATSYTKGDHRLLERMDAYESAAKVIRSLA